MKKRALKLASLCLTAGILFTGAVPVYADETEASDLVGQLAFAQCEEYINIRSGADTDSDVTAKIYNNGAATIIGQVGDWYEIKSGNATGYVKAEYFATGKEAEEIAEAIAYNVATVHPEELNIRTGPSEDYGTLGVAYQSEELEVVDYSGDWMKVALGNDVYGYINAYYVSYDTYYPVAETLEEEQARLKAEQAALEAQKERAQAAAAQPEKTWTETETVQTEETWTETETVQPEETWTETEAVQPEETWTETEAVQPEETWTETEAVQPEETWTETEAVQTETTWTETEAVQPETTWTETEAMQTETTWTETEAVQTETTWTEETETVQTESVSGTGQSIADYAVQFVGNPYLWGGTSLTNGADCSGFTQSVFANFGIGLARTAADQSYGGTYVSLDSLQAGDLVFYSSGNGIDHVAIYIGGGQIVHAANSKSGIIISSCYYSTPVSASRYW